jgi:excisionase family DNA binding protein
MDRAKQKVMTVGELAEYLRIPKSSVYKLAQEDRIPCQKVGRHWRFHLGAIERWLARDGEFDSKEVSSFRK